MPKVRLNYGEETDDIILRDRESRELNLGVVVEMKQEDIDFIKNAEKMYLRAIDLATKYIRKEMRKQPI